MSPTRMEELMKLGVAATETMNINRKGVSNSTDACSCEEGGSIP